MYVVLSAHSYRLPLVSFGVICLLSEKNTKGWVKFDWTCVIRAEHFQPESLVFGSSDRGCIELAVRQVCLKWDPRQGGGGSLDKLADLCINRKEISWARRATLEDLHGVDFRKCPASGLPFAEDREIRIRSVRICTKQDRNTREL